MRRFKLINSQGQELDLMSPQHFFHQPSGLGISRDIESYFVGNQWLQVDEELEQQTISGEMVFPTYQRYSEFSSFAARQPLSLGYAPGQHWYYRSCRIRRLDKREKEEDSGMLVCRIDFLCTGLWNDRVIIYRAEESQDMGKIYDYVYPYTYAESSAGSVAISNPNVVPAHCKLHIMGLAENPTWALSVRGVVTMRGRVSATIPAGHKLVVDSAPATMEIAEYTAGNEYIENRYQDSDYSTARFISAPPGNSVLYFSHDGAGFLNAYVEVSLLAATV